MAYVTVAEMAEELKVSREKVRELLRAGMPHVRPTPRMTRIDPVKAREWLEEQRVASTS